MVSTFLRGFHIIEERDGQYNNEYVWLALFMNWEASAFPAACGGEIQFSDRMVICGRIKTISILFLT
jgi:hypothetical protein